MPDTRRNGLNTLTARNVRRSNPPDPVSLGKIVINLLCYVTDCSCNRWCCAIRRVGEILCVWVGGWYVIVGVAQSDV